MPVPELRVSGCVIARTYSQLLGVAHILIDTFSQLVPRMAHSVEYANLILNLPPPKCF